MRFQNNNFIWLFCNGALRGLLLSQLNSRHQYISTSFAIAVFSGRELVSAIYTINYRGLSTTSESWTSNSVAFFWQLIPTSLLQSFLFAPFPLVLRWWMCLWCLRSRRHPPLIRILKINQRSRLVCVPLSALVNGFGCFCNSSTPITDCLRHMYGQQIWLPFFWQLFPTSLLQFCLVVAPYPLVRLWWMCLWCLRSRRHPLWSNKPTIEVSVRSTHVSPRQRNRLFQPLNLFAIISVTAW